MTYLVEMEFKKNRQGVILESFNALKSSSQICHPSLFSDAASVKALAKDIKSVNKKVDHLKQRLTNALQKPAIHDPVYKLAQHLFTKPDAYSLAQDSKLELAVRRKALRRFLLGCPPRKQRDTSIGDAINWEWIVHCAINSEAEIVIVSRDADYGSSLKGETFLNDWLVQEFKSRVSKKRKISLYTKLSEALKLFAVSVTEKEVKEEEMVAEPSLKTSSPDENRRSLADMLGEWAKKQMEEKARDVKSGPIRENIWAKLR